MGAIGGGIALIPFNRASRTRDTFYRAIEFGFAAGVGHA